MGIIMIEIAVIESNYAKEYGKQIMNTYNHGQGFKCRGFFSLSAFLCLPLKTAITVNMIKSDYEQRNVGGVFKCHIVVIDIKLLTLE